MNSVLFLTGGTGFIGANLIVDVLVHQPETCIIALVRAASRNAAACRLRKAFSSVAPEGLDQSYTARVSAVCGDVAIPGLGLSPEDHLRIISEVTHIIHSAATIDFESPLEEARRVNVGGTRNVLALAREARQQGRLQRIGYIGTAYVSGLREGMIAENELDSEAGFTNNYERSKHEAERAVRQAMIDLPITIFRPSIVVGHSASGVTSSFNVLYPPLRMVHRTRMIALPGFRNIPLDVVPVDYVVRAISHLLFHVSGAVGQAYHLTAGRRSCRAGDIMDMAVAFFNRKSEHDIPRVRFVPPFIFHALLGVLRNFGRHVRRIISIYQPYLTLNRCFDTTNSARDLEAAGIHPPPLPEYLDTLLQFCVDTNWGKRPVRKAA